jgi:flagellin
MEAQKRGYIKTIHNATEAISISQTMSGAYEEVTNIMQRMRELVVQSGNETLSNSDRIAIGAELEELKDEIDKIGGQEFNAKELFGDRFNFHLATDSNTDVGLSLQTQKLAANRLGHQVVVESIQGVEAATSLSTGQISITNRKGETYEVRATSDSDDQLSTQNNSASALAKAAAINSGTNLHGVTARVLSTTVTGQTTQATTLDQTNYIKINGEVVSGFKVSDSDADSVLLDAVNAIEEKTGVVASHNAQGQVVLIAKDGRNIAVEAVGNGIKTGFVNGVFGAKLELQSDETFSMSLNADAVNNALGKFTPQPLISVGGATYGIADGARSRSGQDGVSGIDPNLGANFTLDGVSTGGSVIAISGNDADDFNLKSTGSLIAFEGDSNLTTRSMELNHTITATQTTTVSLNILSGDIDGGNTTEARLSNGNTFESPDTDEGLFLQSSIDGGVSWQDEGTFGGVNIQLPASDNVADSDEQRLIDARHPLVVTKSSDYKLRIIQKNSNGEDFDHFGIVFGEIKVDALSSEPLVFGENYSSSVESMSVATKEAADQSLQILDQAIAEITAAQVTLGALQNRLESTINNMQQTQVNVATAQGRIIDADFAAETAALAQQQIIQRAGISVLAQVNQQSSIALSLL